MSRPTLRDVSGRLGTPEGFLPHQAIKAELDRLELRLYGPALRIVMSTAGIVIGALITLL